MNPFVSRITGNNWVLPVSALSVVLGFMMMLAWMNETNRQERLQKLGPDFSVRWMNGRIDLIEENQKVSAEVAKLRQENTKLQNAAASQTDSSKVLNEGLQEAKMLAGLTDVEGPGIAVTLKDSARSLQGDVESLAGNANIHDYDVLRVVNELWAAGAEAITVNKHRIVGRSSFRCVGPVIHVDGVPIASPVVIKAIGDPDALKGGVNIRFGTLDEIRQGDPNMVEVATFQRAHFSAFEGSTTFKYAKVPKEKK